MGNNTAALLRLLWSDARLSLAAFWSTLIACEIFFLLVSLYFGGFVVVSGWLAVYIFAVISGFAAVQNTFPVALGWSMPRKDYYVAAVIHFVLLALAISVLYMALYGFEQTFTSMFAKGSFQFFTAPFQSEPTFGLLLWLHFIASMTLLSVGFFFGCLYFRFGRLGVMAFFAITVMLIAFLAEKTFAAIGSFEAFLLWLIPFNFVVLGAAWLFLRQAPPKQHSSSRR